MNMVQWYHLYHYFVYFIPLSYGFLVFRKLLGDFHHNLFQFSYFYLVNYSPSSIPKSKYYHGVSLKSEYIENTFFNASVLFTS